MNKHESIELIAKCIHLRDNAIGMQRDELIDLVKEIASYNLVSARQIAVIAGGAISSSTVVRVTKKRSKVGGKINPETLETIREVIFECDLGHTNWKKIIDIIALGTSIEVLVRLSGVSRSTLYRKLRNGPIF